MLYCWYFGRLFPLPQLPLVFSDKNMFKIFKGVRQLIFYHFISRCFPKSFFHQFAMEKRVLCKYPLGFVMLLPVVHVVTVCFVSCCHHDYVGGTISFFWGGSGGVALSKIIFLQSKSCWKTCARETMEKKNWASDFYYPGFVFWY